MSISKPGILLTVLIRPHLDCVAALEEAYNTSICFTKRVQENYLGLIFGVAGSKWRCVSFSVRLEFWIGEDLMTERIPRLLTEPKLVVPGQD